MIDVLETPAQVARSLADSIVTHAGAAIGARAAFFMALSGGTTPTAAYALLAEEPRRRSVDWTKTFIYFGDERCVPPDDPQSNYHMALQTLLAKVDLPAQNVHRIRSELPPSDAARDYAAVLVETMGDLPRFDLILLGMGADGHTASLFPGSDPLEGDDRLVRAPYVEKLRSYRITLTPRVINNARNVVIATEGSPKAPALFAVREGPYDPVTHPIQIVAPNDGTLTWLVDKAAAAELSTK